MCLPQETNDTAMSTFHQLQPGLIIIRTNTSWYFIYHHNGGDRKKVRLQQVIIIYIYIGARNINFAFEQALYILICMMTSSNGNISRFTGHVCGEFNGPGEFPTQRPVTRSFDVYFDLRPNKRLSKQSRGWWFETPSCPFWRERNVFLQRRNVRRCICLGWLNWDLILLHIISGEAKSHAAAPDKPLHQSEIGIIFIYLWFIP